MPVTKSAKKALRRDKKKAEINKPIKSKIKTVVSEARKSPSEENLKKAYSVLDRAAKKKVIKKGRANRLKSRLTNLFNKTAKEKKAPEKKTKKRASK